MELNPIIETWGLTRTYGELKAVKGLTLSIPTGSISAFLGQNGSGKTTTLKMLMGAVRPSSGTGRVLDYAIDNPDQSVEIRKRVAFVSEEKRLYDYMTVRQIIEFTRSFFPAWRADLCQEFLCAFPLPMGHTIKKLSKGMRTQLTLLLAIARNPLLLVLDEPSEGLDPMAIETVLQMLRQLRARGTTIFFSSHQISEVEQIADHVSIIDRGELLVNMTIGQLKTHYRVVKAVMRGSTVHAHLLVRGVAGIRSDGESISVLVTDDPRELTELLRSLGATGITVAAATVKDLYLQTVRGV